MAGTWFALGLVFIPDISFFSPVGVSVETEWFAAFLSVVFDTFSNFATAVVGRDLWFVAGFTADVSSWA